MNTGDCKENDMKCVWMTSGIISYKLCSLNFFCEDCEFDRVMHNETSSNKQEQIRVGLPGKKITSTGRSAHSLDGSLFYHNNHCWVKVVNPDEVLIGINGILAKLIYGVKTAVLPKTGDPAIRDHIFAHILQEKHIVPLIMPVNGIVTAVNRDLGKNPELLRTGFRSKGWLITVKSENLENDLKALMFGSKAMDWYRTKDKSISEKIYAACNANSGNIGATMHDGGEFVANISEVLTPEQYNKILDDLAGKS